MRRSGVRFPKAALCDVLDTVGTRQPMGGDGLRASVDTLLGQCLPQPHDPVLHKKIGRTTAKRPAPPWRTARLPPMSARGRFLSCLATAVIALAGFVTIGALPASGANSSIIAYVALGDSYAAGWGADAADPEDPCQRSAQGYPALLNSQKRIELEANAACKGATTSDVISTQLSALKPDTRLVTLTVGGNDLNVADVAATCTTPGVTAAQCIEEIRNAVAPAQLQALGSHLIDLYGEVAEAAPGARIVVTGYPHLFDPAPGSPNAAIITALNAATDQLNATIKQAVTLTQNADVNIRYVDVTAEFAGHGIFSPNPFINPPGTEAAFHPNALGYSVYAIAIADALPRGWVDKSSRAAATSQTTTP
jgi:lysophospholipase L1-like esterase